MIRYTHQLSQLQNLITEAPKSQFIDKIESLDLREFRLIDSDNDSIKLLLDVIVGNLEFLPNFTTFKLLSNK